MVIDVGERRHREADSVVAAARAFVGPAYVHVFGVSVHGDDAVVVLALDPWAPYDVADNGLEQVEVDLRREDGAWRGVTGTYGDEGCLRGLAGGRLLLTLYGWAPANVRAAELRCLGSTDVVPVLDGGFMFVAWDAPDTILDPFPDVSRWIRVDEP